MTTVEFQLNGKGMVHARTRVSTQSARLLPGTAPSWSNTAWTPTATGQPGHLPGAGDGTGFLGKCLASSPWLTPCTILPRYHVSE